MLFHGEPTWSFLYRKVMPPLARGRAPLHRARLRRLRTLRQADRLRLVQLRPPHRVDDRPARSARACSGATFVVQDWGGPIGMRIAAERPELCCRMVVMDTGLFTGRPADVGRLEELPRLRRADRGPADLVPRRRRLQDEAERRGARRLRRTVPGGGREAGRARLSAVPADHSRRAGRRGGAAHARGDGRVRSPGTAALGRLRPGADARRRPRAREADRLARSPR